MWHLLEKAACFASAKKDNAAAAAWNKNGWTEVLSRGTDSLSYGTAAGEQLDRYAADGVGAMSSGRGARQREPHNHGQLAGGDYGSRRGGDEPVHVACVRRTRTESSRARPRTLPRQSSYRPGRCSRKTGRSLW